jgi:lipopolysaccharide/colanic/teichoic acid biosynthesis glycosyltransferase
MIVKRAFDLVIASLLLAVASPLFVAIAACILILMGRPVFFRQVRPGLRGRPFTIYKFRTMSQATDSQGKPLPDSARLTPLGSWLRRFSLDELPQLINVINGSMSLVGPRPLLMEYLGLYTSRQMRRHDVPPGITGWAQVNGRNALTWEEKFELDVWYVENRSLLLDLKILFATIKRLFLPQGIAQPGEATARKFTGLSSNDHG